ncbi:C40 family peptidase [Amnibacterium flavum]|uniref:NlpC/P60 family protein n=1 Tax=Amnibacterium flavum TaxID=2173173 RepID=A0A2V1HX84_9MICO|nr:C40 family peptidase [Amnibacterium flavum]PVZ95227.1 NlpC/P60 family protein [Amnibacterium flavum]
MRPEVAISAVVIGSVTAAVGVSTAVAAPDYPSWDDVEAAKQNEAAAAAKVDELNGLLSGLQATADAAGRAQQIAAEKYQLAKTALDEATARESDLTDKAAAAGEQAKVSKMRAGLLAAHLARAAGNDLSMNLALNGSESDDLLYQLGTMSKLSEQSQSIYDDALADQKLAASLGSQAKIATTQRAALASEAEAALADAQRTSDAAAAAVAEQQARQSQLFAQLASLKNTTAEAEAGYQAGLTAEKEQQSAPSVPPPPAAPPINDPGTVAPPVADKAATAIAFARAQIGDAYQFAGEGPDRWDCSGLTMKAYAAAGLSIGGHSATAQYNTARNRGQLVPYSQAQPGDLIFYSEDGSDMYHVTIYTGGGRMVEAPYDGVPVREVSVRSYERVAYVARPSA